ncbi:MAG: type II secretion system protein [Planctomycetes bacterium]|nr:type II secretion system protein [Planctomycetota bacterium]
MLRKKSTTAFTLIEIALSLAILITGLTAVISIYMVSFQWIEEIRVDLTALQTGRVIMVDAGLLMDENDARLEKSNLDASAKGWINDYYVVRTVETQTVPGFTASDKAGTYITVRIQVYYGGTDEDGLLSHDFSCDQIIPYGYVP